MITKLNIDNEQNIDAGTSGLQGNHHFSLIISHFLVDALCVCCLFQMAAQGGAVPLLGVFMLYNVLAFLTQPLTGMLADRVARRQLLLVASVALLSAAVLTAAVAAATTRGSVYQLSGIAMYAVATLLGMGNSLFHVWGGKQVAVATDNDMRALGAFVSTGAFGLAVGVALHSWLLLIVLLAALVATATVAITTDTTAGGAATTVRRTLSPAAVWGSVLLLMGVVMLRSLVGEVFSASIVRGAVAVTLLIGAVAMAGKMAGGWLARSMGIVPSMSIVVAAVVVCLLTQGMATAVPWIGLLTVNLTMAVTLYLANIVMPRREGLAFGLLAAALMPGYLLAMYGTGGSWVVPQLLMALLPTIAVEAGVLWLMRERRADVLWASVVVNILTNVPLNIFLLSVGSTWPRIIVCEAVVIIVEALWYAYFTGSWRRGAVYSVLCNAISFLLGMLAQLCVMLFQTLY